MCSPLRRHCGQKGCDTISAESLCVSALIQPKLSAGVAAAKIRSGPVELGAEIPQDRCSPKFRVQL